MSFLFYQLKVLNHTKKYQNYIIKIKQKEKNLLPFFLTEMRLQYTIKNRNSTQNK